MKCEKCAKEIPVDSKFCPYCGLEIAVQTQAGYSKEKEIADMTQDGRVVKCNVCGRDFPAGSKYCPYCGDSISKMADNVLEAAQDAALGGANVPVQDIEE